MIKSLFRRKTIDAILKSSDHADFKMKRMLGPASITMLGIGAIIGTGVFATIGTATAGDALRLGAGPSLMLSFVVSAIVCAFTALCYAELASLVPVSGSAYTYSYATLGELVAWIIGWDLIIEYGIGNSAVAISWANYFRSLMHEFGYDIPLWLATDYRTGMQIPELVAQAPTIFGVPIIFNMLAFSIVMIITAVLVWGIKESARFNALMVVIKVLVLAFFVGMGLAHVPTETFSENWVPFQPNGWGGTLAGAAIIFFAYIGFDAVSTVAEETKNPKRDLPIGIIASLIICTVFYVIIAAVFTGMVPYQELIKMPPTARAEPLTMALNYVSPDTSWATAILAFGSVVAQTAVLMVFQLGQPRIFFAMARDGLLPRSLAKVHPRFRTPHVATILTGFVVALISGTASLDEMVDLSNIGTLFAFMLVCLSIPILRFYESDRERSFQVPFGPWILPIMGALSCLFLMVYLPPASWWRFIGWLVLGLSVYASYGFCRSVVGKQAGRPRSTPFPLKLAAVGFLFSGVGFFVMPHDLGLFELVSRFSESPRALLSVCSAALGLGLGLGGTYVATKRKA